MHPYGRRIFNLYHKSKANNDKAQKHNDKNSGAVPGIKRAIVQIAMGTALIERQKAPIEFSNPALGAFTEQPRPKGRDWVNFWVIFYVISHDMSA